jgi:FkbM family methyltransferase
MGKIRQILNIFKSINRHPLARRHTVKCYLKFVGWQLRSAILTRPKEVRFTSKSKLLVKKGMAGATGNIYMGLHEFEDMALLLHYLTPDDVFFDVGANIGSYTILASAHCGATSYAFEPVPQTFNWITANVAINSVDHLVIASNKGLGSKEGILYFTSDIDTINHVVSETSCVDKSKLLAIPVTSIDQVVERSQVPVMIKIDVEGFETAVLDGMEKTLCNDQLKIIIIELNGLAARYNFSDQQIHERLLAAGFQPYQYVPFDRMLILLGSFGVYNTIYIRDVEAVQKRLKSAPSFEMLGEMI